MSSAQIKSTYMSIGALDVSIPPSSLVLKLAINLKSIRYYIQATSHNQIILFGKYTLHHVKNTGDLISRLERIVEKDESLQLAFSKVVIGIDTAYTLMPSEGSQPQENVLVQKIEEAGLDIAFSTDDLLKYSLTKLFKNTEIVHLNSSLLKLLPEYARRETTDKLFVNVEQDYLDIIRYSSDHQLQLMNRYPYRHENDFIYYLLLCAEDLKIDRQTVDLVLLGEVDIQSQIYALCYRYFRNLGFIQQPSNISFTKAFDLYPKHLHFNLYNLSA
ncbi:MAG: DUF3822 family protein [Bacteroidetes bacterium]|nr:DUF3822 family protein [Bacteroidota bacterium]